MILLRTLGNCNESKSAGLSWAFGSFHSSLKAWSKSIHKMEGSKILSWCVRPWDKKKRQLQYQPGETMNNHEPIRQMWMVGSRQDTNENHWEPSSCSAYPLQTRDFDCYKHSWPLFRSFPSNSVKYFLLDISRFAAVFQRSILSHVSGSSGFISQRSLLWKCWKCHDFTSCILWRPVGWNGGQHRFSHA